MDGVGGWRGMMWLVEWAQEEREGGQARKTMVVV